MSHLQGVNNVSVRNVYGMNPKDVHLDVVMMIKEHLTIRTVRHIRINLPEQRGVIGISRESKSTGAEVAYVIRYATVINSKSLQDAM